MVLITKLLEKPLEQWNDGQLKFEVASLLNEPRYLFMLEYEKEDRKYPISKDEMIKFIRLERSKELTAKE